MLAKCSPFLLFTAPCNPDCMNGGSCENEKCVCRKGYSGSYCQIGMTQPWLHSLLLKL